MYKFFHKLRDNMPARRKHILELQHKLNHQESLLRLLMSFDLNPTDVFTRLNLMLVNAHIPPHYYDIFYRMLQSQFQNKISQNDFYSLFIKESPPPLLRQIH